MVANLEKIAENLEKIVEILEKSTIDPTQRYLTFISIVFGVFFAVWIVPLSNYFRGPPKDDIKTTLDTLWSLNMARGAVTFVMLVCLWWWYGTFIGNIAPAEGYWVFLFDFVTLCSFAVAFRMWDHRTLFPLVVFFAAGLMLARFGFAYQEIVAGSNAEIAVSFALGILAFFMLGAICALIGGLVVFKTALNTNSRIILNETSHDKILWKIVEYGILFLLVIGIGVTFHAVKITEGLPFETPIKPEVWMNKPGP